jgi:hypothetical protein
MLAAIYKVSCGTFAGRRGAIDTLGPRALSSRNLEIMDNHAS